MTERQPTDDSQGPTAKGQEPTAIDAPRPNHSTGPKTPEGKARCRLNAYRHGLTGEINIQTAEENLVYEKHCKIVLDALAPLGDFECEIAQTIADDRWRLKRARAIESNTFNLGPSQNRVDSTNHAEVNDAFAQARTWAEQARNLDLLTVYMQRINRSMEKNMAHLKTLQTERKQAAQEAMRQAKLLYQLAQAEGKPYQPEAFFSTALEFGESVFSTPEVAREVSRAKLLAAAKIFDSTGKLPKKSEPEQPQEAADSQHPTSSIQHPIANNRLS